MLAGGRLLPYGRWSCVIIGVRLTRAILREIPAEAITEAVAHLYRDANTRLPEDVLAALRAARDQEDSPAGREALEQIIRNAEVAAQDCIAMCQDTGVAVVFLDIGQEVHITGGGLEEAVNEGVRRGCQEGYLRPSVVADPLHRENTGDNTPAVMHVCVVPGEGVRIAVAPKGAGAENKSALKMLTPADGVEGVKRFVVETVSAAGPDACPPLIVGVGLGGNFEGCALLAKRALLRRVGQPSPEQHLAELERELLEEVNALGIGPSGFGGRTTALAVHVEVAPCHIASLPVAVNIQCHAARHAETAL
jgi:fumarate hydratase subunit alpha